MRRLGAHRLLWLAALLGASACARAPAGVTVLPTPTQVADADDWHQAEDLLSARMRSIAEGLAATGQVPADFAQRGFLASGARVTHELRTPPGHCLTVVALATSGIADLDASIFEADGRAVSQDAASDARPVLRACAGEHERRLYYVLHAFAGSGSYLVASFEGPLEHGQSGDFSDSEPGPASHADWTAALVRRGFEPEGPPVELDLEPDSQVRVALPARVGQCVALVAFAAKGEADVNLWLADEAGVDRVRDDARRPWAGVQLCPDASGVFAARVGVRGGAARVQVGRFAGRASHVGGERAMWLGEPVLPEGAVAEQSAAKAATASGGGTSGTLVAGAVEERALRLPAARCAELGVELGDGLRRVDVSVDDAAGRPLGRAQVSAPAGSLHVCGAGARRVRVRIEARRGVGHYQLHARAVESDDMQVFVSSPPAAAGPLLDLRANALQRGWPAPELTRLSAADMHCLPSGECRWARRYTGLGERCLSAALVDGTGRPSAVSIHAEGQADASASHGYTTRCVHPGTAELRVRTSQPPVDGLYVLSVQHDAPH